ncbi:MAG: outer membrane beta-barrel protein [Alistipes sp.]|nr:outer membrane beta-barrel protein [Alistipes sp.]
MMTRVLKTIAAAAIMILAAATAARAQHTVGFTLSYGMGSSRLYPAQETRGVWGLYGGGVAWRYYTSQRFVGGFGLDLEFQQKAFSFVPNPSRYEDEADYEYYTRHVNSVVLPIVWQPHFYIRRRVRVYFEAAATFNYNISSTYVNEYAKSLGSTDYEGKYEFKTVRDNRWGYGLAGGGGIAVLFGQFELNMRVRYYFGYSDIVKNRNKYYDNGLDGAENPFYYTPVRSPLDNLMISVGMNFRIGRAGFTEWDVKRRKRDKRSETFNYRLD